MSGKMLLIRADASAEIGAGHVMRCLALAQAWQRIGGCAMFALATGGELVERIRSEGAEVKNIEAEPGSIGDLGRTAEFCRQLQAEWLLLDGYHFSADYRRTLRNASPYLLLMDDGEASQPCDCDVVLNPDPNASDRRYMHKEGIQFLLGPRYALLRHEFLEFRGSRREFPETAKNVLVTLGGGDRHNVTLQVFQALQDLNDLELELTVVVGPNYQHWPSLEKALSETRHAAELRSNVENMPHLISRVDLAITAGGGTCYELAFMRVPMFLITIAKNHERAVDAYASSGAAVSAGWFNSLERGALASSLRRVICDRNLRMKLAESAGRMVDGRGAERVVETMQSIRQREGRVTA